MPAKTGDKRGKAGFRIFFAYLEEVGLTIPLREICKAHTVTLFDTYLDTKGPTVHAARLECWWWLQDELGKSAGEVAKLYNREPGSILFGMRALKAMGEEMDVQLAPDTVRVLARFVTTQSATNRSNNGLRSVQEIAARARARRCDDE